MNNNQYEKGVKIIMDQFKYLARIFFLGGEHNIFSRHKNVFTVGPPYSKLPHKTKSI